MNHLIIFSICIPVHNRERLIGRAIRSCLTQKGDDFEIIVTDDGSTDRTVAVIEAIHDPRIRLLRHEGNHGHAAARNTAEKVAAGEWIVVLDSDDELLPGSLDLIRSVVQTGGSEVKCYEFMCRRDDGKCSPDPPLVDGRISYEHYLRRINKQRRFDPLLCIRRSAAHRTPWYESQFSGSVLHSLDLHREHCCAAVSADVGLIHTDATNRISWVRRSPNMARTVGVELGLELDLILSRHGTELQRLAPLTWRRLMRVRASYYFLQGSRWSGVIQTLRCLQSSPLSAEVWAQLMIGLASPQMYARIRGNRPPPT